MLISSELKQTNIAEYILYMWQTEDILRSFEYDIDRIKSEIVDKYDVSDEIKNNIALWYQSIIDMSELENVKKSGHLQILRNIVNDLYDLHLWLLGRANEVQYKQAFDMALPHIKALEEKMQGTAENDIDVCLHGLYALMLLKMKQTEISSDTLAAIETFRKLIALLSSKYKEREEHPEKYY